MKHLKHINEYNTDVLYHKIFHSEFHKLRLECIKITTKTYNNILENNIGKLEMVNDYVVAVIDKGNDIDIYQLDDDYYLVRFTNLGNMPAMFEYYKCDTIEGLIQLINNKLDL
jgi:hypothetical protein